MQIFKAISSTRLFLLFAVTIGICSANIKFRKKNDNSTTEEVAYSSQPWELSQSAVAILSLITPSTPAKFINLDQAYGSYNPCDTATFTSAPFDNIFPNKQPWIGFTNADKLQALCGHVPLHWYYMAYGVRWTQALGAAGYFKLGGAPSVDIVTIPPGVDVGLRTISGVVIAIPSLSVQASVKVNQVLSSPQDFEIISFVGEANPVKSLQNIFGAYRILFTLQGIYVSLLLCYTIYHTYQVLVFFEFGRNQKIRSSMNLRLMILVSEIIGGVARIVFCIDPVGVFYIENFLFSRSMLNLAADLSCFTNIVTVFFCYDVYRIFRDSRLMLRSEMLSNKYTWLQSAILLVAFLLIFADETLNLMALNGLLGSRTTLIPSIYQLIVNLAVLVATLRLNCLAMGEIDLMLDAAKGRDAANKAEKGKASLASNGEDFVKTRLAKFNRTRQYMMRAGYGVALGVVTIASIAAGVIYISTLSYAIIMQTIMLSLNIIMTFQVLAASELPVKVPVGNGKAALSTKSESSHKGASQASSMLAASESLKAGQAGADRETMAMTNPVAALGKTRV